MNEPISDILDALDMPADGLRQWFGQLRSFGEAHGGARHYAELFELLESYESSLDERGSECA